MRWPNSFKDTFVPVCAGETPPRQPPKPALSEVEGTAALLPTAELQMAS